MFHAYPLVICHIAMERSTHFNWENPLFLWSFSIDILTEPEGTFNYQVISSHLKSKKPVGSMDRMRMDPTARELGHTWGLGKCLVTVTKKVSNQWMLMGYMRTGW